VYINPYLLNRIRIIFILALFYVLYEYTKPVYSFLFIFYMILSDLSDIESDASKLKEDTDKWTSTLIRRKDF
jgi:hypothetical protein